MSVVRSPVERGTSLSDEADIPPGSHQGPPDPSDSILVSSPSPNIERFFKFSGFTLIYTLACVGWGVFVRTSRSGDGCGNHWPLCDGDHTPLMGVAGRIVELSHRMSTALIGLLALILVVWAFRAFPKRHLVRKSSIAVLLLTILVGLVGWALVRYELVTYNDSALRAGVLAFHIVCIYMMVSAMALVWLGSVMKEQPVWRGQGPVAWIFGGLAAGIILLGVTGAIAALGNQLRPVDNVLQAAANPATFWMVRIQPLHPLLAGVVGLFLLLAAGLLNHLRPNTQVRIAIRWMVGLFFAQMVLGALTILFKAPIGLQMAHLVLADINFLSVAVVAALAFCPSVPKVELRPVPAGLETPRLVGRELMNAYIALTKPRVISLLLFTAVAASFAAQGGWPGWAPFMAVMVGGYMAAGAANAINMVIDRDIDMTMERTRTRPTVTQSVPSNHVLAFSLLMIAGSLAILASFTNLLAAAMALSGLVFYVVVYTMLMKRRTWLNIVVGGAAGSFPPLVGWAAVTNSLPPLALFLFVVIFLWTPVHFWALALLLKDEYEAAGVPMLPVVKGDQNTVLQILGYTALTVLTTVAAWQWANLGWVYLAGAVVLNGVLVWMGVDLYRSMNRQKASRLFHYSMLYLALFFLVFAVDRSIFKL